MSQPQTDSLVVWTLRFAAAATGSIVVLIFAMLIGESFEAIRAVGGRFFTDPSWRPNEHAEAGQFGLWPMIWGSLLVTAGGCALASPVGVGSAVFCRFYGGRAVVVMHRRLLELLAGIPSVVYGFWGLVVLAPWVGWIHPPGQSLLTGVLVVALMVTPTIALTADAALGAVPVSSIRAAAALGMGRWAVVRHIAIPEARHGLATAVTLGAARAVGETMAVLMVCGNVVKTPRSLFDPVRTLTANIALEMGYALGDHRSALFASGLLLMVIVMALIAAAELFQRRSGDAQWVGHYGAGRRPGAVG